MNDQIGITKMEALLKAYSVLSQLYCILLIIIYLFIATMQGLGSNYYKE